jgi:hypothetical protein
MRRTGWRRLISLGFYPLDYRGEFAYRGRRIKLAGFLIFRLWEHFLILKTIVLEKTVRRGVRGERQAFLCRCRIPPGTGRL